MYAIYSIFLQYFLVRRMNDGRTSTDATFRATKATGYLVLIADCMQAHAPLRS